MAKLHTWIKITGVTHEQAARLNTIFQDPENLRADRGQTYSGTGHRDLRYPIVMKMTGDSRLDEQHNTWTIGIRIQHTLEPDDHREDDIPLPMHIVRPVFEALNLFPEEGVLIDLEDITHLLAMTSIAIQLERRKKDDTEEYPLIDEAAEAVKRVMKIAQAAQRKI